jgi:hypothetical protein
MKTKCVWLTPALILSLFLPGHSQRTSTWVKKVEKGQYTEGVYSLNVSASLEIISFYSHFEPYETGRNQQLRVDFFSPTEDYYLFKAEEKRILSYYWLESKPGRVKKGKNHFGPLSVDGLIQSLNVSPSNLGFLLRLKDDKSDYLLPVSVYHSTPASQVENYQAVFRLGKSISGGEFKVYKGEYSGLLPEKQLVQSGRIGRNLGGATFQIAIDAAPLAKYEGWMTVHLSMTERNSIQKLPFRFYFYHQ